MSHAVGRALARLGARIVGLKPDLQEKVMDYAGGDRRHFMQLAGRFADGSGGAMLIGAVDDASAQAIVAADPAVVAETFTYELRQWAFVNWASLAKRAPG